MFDVGCWMNNARNEKNLVLSPVLLPPTELVVEKLDLVEEQNDHYLLGIHHRAHTDSQRLFGHFGQVVVEKAGIGDDRIVCQSLQTGSRRFAGQNTNI